MYRCLDTTLSVIASGTGGCLGRKWGGEVPPGYQLQTSGYPQPGWLTEETVSFPPADG